VVRWCDGDGARQRTTKGDSVADDFDPGTVTWVLTEHDLEHLLAAIDRAEEVVADLETTGLDEHAYLGGARNGGYPARIVLAALTLPTAGDPPLQPSTWVLPLSHPDSPWIGRWRRTMRRVAEAMADRAWVNANVKFDSRWTWAHTKVDLSHVIGWDTKVSSHLLDENSSTKLKERAPATFGVERWDDFDLSVPGAAERVPMFDLGLYAARDTYWTWRLAELHRRQMFLAQSEGEAVEPPDNPEDIENAKLGRLAVWCSMPTVATLSAVEQRGMRLDVDWVRRELAEHLESARGLAESMAGRYPAAGLDERWSFAPTSLWFQAWTQAAVKAGDLAITALTGTGKPQWSRGVLGRQARAGSLVAQGILDQRSHDKKAQFLASWLNYVTPEGLIHCEYNSGSVVTGRLSSSNPNMQQVTASLRPAFVPRDGCVFIDLDYSQIELRVVAFVSRSEPMLEAFRNGWDLHRMVAAQITGKSEADVLPHERQHGKAANFGLVYGMGAAGFRAYAEDVYGVTMTAEEAQTATRAFFETWDGVQQWHQRVIRRVHSTGQVVSPIGRVRRLPDIYDGNDERVSGAERAAINSPVQGFASDLMMMAASSIEGTLPGHEPVRGAAIVATVHDDIVVEAPEDDWERVGAECVERMVSIGSVLTRMDCRLDVPLAAEAKIGTRWGLSDVGVLLPV
jgi:DNA polymerase-1